MQSSLHVSQAIAAAEGINERIKARLNTKSKIQPSPQQEEKLEAGDGFEDEFDEDDEFFEEEMFDEATDIYDEYYADEVLKISRYITFREPPPSVGPSVEGAGATAEEKPEANVKAIGSISIPRGTVLQKGVKLVVFKDEMIDLDLEDIVPEDSQFVRGKLPAPIVKTLSPNFAEINSRANFTVIGENLSYDQKARFNNKNIQIEDIKAGPFVEVLIGDKVKSGLTSFYWESAKGEFYIIPSFDGSVAPVITEVKNTQGEQLLDLKAGQRGVVLMIYGIDLFLNKSLPVIIPDACGVIPKVKDQLPNGKEVTITLDIEPKVEPGIHTLSVATEGGLSNTWLFNILPADETVAEFSANSATFTSSLTLLDVMVIQNLLPLIDEDEELENQADPDELADEEEDETDPFAEEIPEKEKLSPFANTDLETVWLLETSTKVGMTIRTVSETIRRTTPDIMAALITNGKITFNGGGYNIIGQTTAMTILREATYVSNTALAVPGPPEEGEEVDESQPPPQSPGELGFTPGSYVAVYKAGEDIDELDYAVIKSVGRDTIELVPPGFMDFHYQGDGVFQFTPGAILNAGVIDEETKKHIVPPGFLLKIPKSAVFRNIFMANLEQFSELADYYSKDSQVPKDEYGIPLGFVGLSYIESTPVFDATNVLTGKGVLVIDTRGDNLGEPTGSVEITGDSRNQVDFTGVLYVHGNLRIEGNVNITGAVIVDNDSRGEIEIGSNALGMIAYDERAITQVLLSTPFTTSPGTVMITSKPLNLGDYVQSGSEAIALGAAPSVPGTEGAPPEIPPETMVAASEVELVEAEVKPKAPEKSIGTYDLFDKEEIKDIGGGKKEKSPEEELIDLF
ncbi:MAG: hypothetical protein HYZ79_06135 [Candidatus Melainabacteria bacterium]|nr:hypothetical protein [Candidatus Melainabacteria bacterium]